MHPIRLVNAILITVLLATQILPQSGAARVRTGGRDSGVNLTFAAYQFDAARSPVLDDVVRLTSTFSSADEEIAHLKEKYKLEEVAVRHIRSVGLTAGEAFTDAVLLGPEYMVFTVVVTSVERGRVNAALKAKYANEPLLEVKDVEIDNYETVLFRGGKGMFGLKYFVGAGGAQESAPIERTLLVSVTPEIGPVTSLRNRPEQLSRPVDEFGRAIDIKDSDRFTPPVALERAVPKFEAGRKVEGSVLLGGIVTPEGSLTNVRVLRSLEPAIDQRAVDAFRQYRFSPGLLNGKPVHATFREELTFAPARPSLRELQEELEKQRKKEDPKKKPRRRFP